MNNQTSTDQLLTIVHRDSDLIVSGSVNMPTRDDSGNRPLTPGEKEIIGAFDPEVRQNHDEIEKADQELAKCDEEREVISQEMAKEIKEYTQEKQAVDAQLEHNQKQRDLLDHNNPTDAPTAPQPKPKKRGKKEGAKKMISFVSIAFLAEVVTSLATINLQQETLSMDVILWRFAYIFVIYIFTCILYAKYLKTRIKAVKGLLVGCFLMSLACLLHAVVLTFINVDVAAPVATADFNLNAIETVAEVTASASILSNFINNPGLIEFIIATLLVFAGETLTIDVKNKQVEEPIEPSHSPTQGFENVDFDAVAQENARRHREKLEREQKNLLQSRNQKAASISGFGAKMENRLEEIKNRKDGISAAKILAKQRKELIDDRRYSVLAQYGNLLRSDIAIRLGVEVSSIKYEPVLREDIEAYDRAMLG